MSEEKQKDEKLKFEENIWILFKLNNLICIGRTILYEGVETVVLVDENCGGGAIDYSTIKTPIKIHLVEMQKENPGTIQSLNGKPMCLVLGEA